MRRFTRIKGVTDLRRLPRLGKIRLGVKAKTPDGKEYPKEVDYFVVPSEVAKVYGEQPKEIDIMFPVDDPEMVFPQAYEYYGAGAGLKCSGDGETAMRANDKGELEEIQCPCDLLEKKKCQRKGHLMVVLPKISLGGVYQVDVGSFWSITELNSYLDWTRALVGKIAMVPLKLKRVPMEMTYEGIKRTHYVLKLVFEGGMDEVKRLHSAAAPHQFALPEPPAMEPFEEPPVVVTPEGAVVDPQTGEILGEQPVDAPSGGDAPDAADDPGTAATAADLSKALAEATSIQVIDDAIAFLDNYPELVGEHAGRIRKEAANKKAALTRTAKPATPKPAAPPPAHLAGGDKAEEAMRKMLADAKTPAARQAAWTFVSRKQMAADAKVRLKAFYESLSKQAEKAA